MYIRQSTSNRRHDLPTYINRQCTSLVERTSSAYSGAVDQSSKVQACTRRTAYMTYMVAASASGDVVGRRMASQLTDPGTSTYTNDLPLPSCHCRTHAVHAMVSTLTSGRSGSYLSVHPEVHVTVHRRSLGIRYASWSVFVGRFCRWSVILHLLSGSFAGAAARRW